MKIRPITGSLESALSQTNEIPATLMAVFIWLQDHCYEAMQGNHHCHDGITFIKHGHEDDTEWGRGYVVNVDGIPRAVIDSEIPMLDSQRQTWDQLFKQLRFRIYGLFGNGHETERQLIKERLTFEIEKHLIQEKWAALTASLLISLNTNKYEGVDNIISQDVFSTMRSDRYLFHTLVLGSVET